MRRDEIIRKAMELGHLHGFVTFDQLNELFSQLSRSDTAEPEDIEAVMEALSEACITVVEAD